MWVSQRFAYFKMKSIAKFFNNLELLSRIFLPSKKALNYGKKVLLFLFCIKKVKNDFLTNAFFLQGLQTILLFLLVWKLSTESKPNPFLQTRRKERKAIIFASYILRIRKEREGEIYKSVLSSNLFECTDDNIETQSASSH